VIPLRSVVVENFREISKGYEGEVPWMYLDTHVPPLVTVAVGNLIDPVSEALKLPFVHEDGTRASMGEIAAEWQTIKQHTELAHQGYLRAKAFCKLHLTDDAIDSLVREKLAANWTFMCGKYSCFANAASWPAAAQLAASLMAWAVGAGFPGIFKNWAVQAAQQNWGEQIVGADGKPTGKYTGCAGTCWINATNNPGVIPRNKANIGLFLLAGLQAPEDYNQLHIGEIDWAP
jgi:hypothetical protein